MVGVHLWIVSLFEPNIFSHEFEMNFKNYDILCLMIGLIKKVHNIIKHLELNNQKLCIRTNPN
jgi:hypothetical protein